MLQGNMCAFNSLLIVGLRDMAARWAYDNMSSATHSRNKIDKFSASTWHESMNTHQTYCLMMANLSVEKSVTNRIPKDLK